jgi:hypothetical protein
MGIELILGHLVGDYIFQFHQQAAHKKDAGWRGWTYCMEHCILYTIIVCLFIGRWDWIAVAGIGLSHYIVDRYKWLGWLHAHVYKRPPMVHKAGEPVDDQLAYNTSLSVFVYIMMDNTIHLVLMYLILRYL